MRSPTGKGIRKLDHWGSGEYGARRGQRLHDGVDYVGIPGQDVYMPILGVLERIAKPHAGDYSGVLIRAKNMSIMLFYFWPFPGMIGQEWREGDVIGKMQDITKKYDDRMAPHIHMRINSMNPDYFIGMLDGWKADKFNRGA